MRSPVYLVVYGRDGAQVRQAPVDAGARPGTTTEESVGVFDLKDVVHHTDRGSQYTSTRFSERLAEADIQPSVGAVGSSYDNALAKTINGLYKTEPWRSMKTSSWPPHAGSTGSTIADSTNTVATSHQSNSRLPITLDAGDQPQAELSGQKVSGLTGAAH